MKAGLFYFTLLYELDVYLMPHKMREKKKGEIAHTAKNIDAFSFFLCSLFYLFRDKAPYHSIQSTILLFLLLKLI